MTDTAASVGMDEIAQLQRELEEAQSSGSAVRLSKRNCVQIVMKLQEMGIIELLYTIDGKEYLTREQLKKEVETEIYVHNGRVNIVDLVELLNVDLVHIDRVVAEILEEDAHLHLVQGELVTDVALDNIAAEVNEVLQEAGMVETGSMCQRFGLPSEFLVQRLKERVGTLIKGTLESDGTTLITDAFVARQKAIVRGLFSATTRPVMLSIIASRHHLDGRYIREVLEELIAAKRLPGTLSSRGETAKYVPSLQTKTQERWIDAFYKQNDFLEYGKVAALGVTNAKKYLKARFPGAVALDSCIISETVLDTVNAYIEEALLPDAQGFIDVMPLLPSPCVESDVVDVLKKCPAYATAKNIVIVNETVLVSAHLLERCTALFQPLMESKAKALPASALLELQGGSTTASATGGGQDSSERSSSKGAKKGKGKRKKDTSFPDDDDEGSASASRVAGSHDGGRKGGKSQAASLQFLSLGEVQETLEKELPELAEVDELAAAIAALLHRDLEKKYIEVAKTCLQSGLGTQDRRKQREGLEREVNLVVHHMQIFSKNAASFDEATQALIQKHIIHTLAPNALDALCKLHALSVFSDLDYSKPLSTEDRRKVVNQLPPKTKEQLQTLQQQAASGKEVDDVVATVLDAANEAQIFVRDLDKKTEKALNAEHRQALLASLYDAEDPAVVLHLVTAVLFLVKKAQALHFPGRCVPAVIQELTSKLNEEEATLLADSQKRVVEGLRQQSASGDSPAEDDAGPPAVDVAALKALVL